MTKYSFPALPGIVFVERVLGSLLGPHVYVGGACVGFYIDDPAAPEMRPTKDVDIVVELTTDAERAALDESLRRAGLQHDLEGPICRWRLKDIVIDVMPTNPDILGFSNRWYPEALAGAQQILVEDLSVSIPHICTFIATKVEAFHDRGKNDFMSSPDFEDIVTILDGCSYVVKSAETAPREVLFYLSQIFDSWLSKIDFVDAIAAHLVEDGEFRINLVNGRFNELIELAKL